MKPILPSGFQQTALELPEPKGPHHGTKFNIPHSSANIKGGSSQPVTEMIKILPLSLNEQTKPVQGFHYTG